MLVSLTCAIWHTITESNIVRRAQSDYHKMAMDDRRDIKRLLEKSKLTVVFTSEFSSVCYCNNTRLLFRQITSSSYPR